jgi:arsenate reductase
MADALLRKLGGDGFKAISAGSRPAGYVHDLAIEAMRQMDVPLDHAVSKSWDEFATTPVHVVITLCDQAADETCPVWNGAPICVHWSMPDPAFYLGNEEERIEFAVRVATRLRHKIEGLMAIDFDEDRDSVTQRLEQLGDI